MNRIGNRLRILAGANGRGRAAFAPVAMVPEMAMRSHIAGGRRHRLGWVLTIEVAVCSLSTATLAATSVLVGRHQAQRRNQPAQRGEGESHARESGDRCLVLCRMARQLRARRTRVGQGLNGQRRRGYRQLRQTLFRLG